DPTVRNGYQGIEMKVRIEGDADTADLKKVVERSVSRSAVFDMLSNGTNVSVEVEE
ncbi:MAG: OsmC family peroxiredoxin, partial [Acidimicrobiia bacterium]|nr:OsmC family peroxiredoxin [Acidimicrobiia bacterium]